MTELRDEKEKLAALRELTPRQLEVLKLTCQALTQKDIGDKLAITTDAVGKHMANIYVKLKIAGEPDGNTVVEKQNVDPRVYLLVEYCPLLSKLDDPSLLVTAEVFIEEDEDESDASEPQPDLSNWKTWAIGGVGFVTIAALILIVILRPWSANSIASVTPTATSTPTVTATTTATPTPTSTPTLTPSSTNSATATASPTKTPTPVPLSISCGQSVLVSHVFPQFMGKVPFWGPVENPIITDYFLCEGVTDPDPVRSDPGVLQVVYWSTGNRDDFAFFGLALDGFDASAFQELCLKAYASRPNQAFWLKMKDINDYEGQVEVVVRGTDSWLPQCVDLEQYASQGVDLRKLENISLGFDVLLGDAELWLDDFELIE